MKVKRYCIVLFRFALLNLFGLVLIFYVPLELWYLSWPKVKAEIIKSVHEYDCYPPNSPKCTPKATIVYKYDIIGKSYTCNNYSLHGVYKPSSIIHSFKTQQILVERLLNNYPVNSSITVYYNKNKPHQAAINPNMSMGEWLYIIVWTFIGGIVVRSWTMKNKEHLSLTYDFKLFITCVILLLLGSIIGNAIIVLLTK